MIRATIRRAGRRRVFDLAAKFSIARPDFQSGDITDTL
jgi:hypothetical protein